MKHFIDKQTVLARIKKSKIVSVVRTDSEKKAETLVETLVKGGINIVEITMTTPNAVRLIEKLSQKYEAEVLVGAGTVLDASAAQQCLEAGAKFVVSPIYDLPTVEICRRADVAVIPGAMTVNEISAAWNSGADVVKIFPANALGGAPYIKAVKTVLPQIKLLPTGGINLESAADYLRAGAIAVGIGSELLKTDSPENDPKIITSRIQSFLADLKP